MTHEPEVVNFGQKLILGVLGGMGALGAAIVGWLGIRGKNVVDAGAAANKAAIDIINELQEERRLMTEERTAFQKERSEWTQERADFRKRLLDCEALERGLEQYIYSLEELLRRQGIDIPRRQPVRPILILDQDNGGSK